MTFADFNAKLNALVTEFIDGGDGDPARCGDALRQVANEVFEELPRMRTFNYIIGTLDDFESFEDLEAAYRAGTIGERNASVFTFTVPDQPIEEMTVEIARHIGFGMAFQSDWCMDGTCSGLIED